jgi:putative aldouronate transport system permease protein
MVKKELSLFLLCLPLVAILFLFNYLPMPGIIMAFKDFQPMQGLWNSPWIGLENFKFFFRSPQTWEVTRNTLAYNLAFIILTPVLSVTTALLLYEIGRSAFIKLYQTIFFLPYFLSWVVVSIMLYAFLNTRSGLLNVLIKSMGGDAVSWYTSPGYWPFILVFMGLWKNVGYNTIIYYAGLMGIDTTLYEAASIDGAGRFRRMRSITVPLLFPLIAVLTILALGSIFFSDFGLHYQVPLQSGPLLPAVDVINYFTYRALMEVHDYGMGTAIGLYQSVMGLIMVVVSNWGAKKISAGESGIF